MIEREGAWTNGGHNTNSMAQKDLPGIEFSSSLKDIANLLYITCPPLC